MYHLNDTIAAVSSPGNDHRVIVRLSGSQTVSIINQIFTPVVSGNPGITSGKILNLDSTTYLFRQPHSYTGEDLAEIHIWANPAVTETLIEKLLALGVRPAQAGEFTARAYLNGKIDLAQAEAVNEVITSSNTFQLAAAENLLAGQLGRTKEKISSSLLDILCMLEAGLDFGTEDIEPGNKSGEIRALSDIINQLREQLAGSVQCESTIDLPAVGIAGAPNAGKSTLLNKLLGRQRSIVSHQRKTTRDVLTGELVLHDCRCLIFDCAGLITKLENILDELTQTAAIEALRNALVVIFCVDISKPDWTEDLAAWRMSFRAERSGVEESILNRPLHLPLRGCGRGDVLSIPVATKADLLSEKEFLEKTLKLKSLFGCDFLPISAHTGFGFDKLKAEIAGRIIAATSGHNKEGIALTSRHKQALNNAIHDIVQAEKEIKAGNDEIACMMLRTAHNQLSTIEQHNVNEQILDRIFSRFCIGK